MVPTIESQPVRVPRWIESAIMHYVRWAAICLAAWGVLVVLGLLYVVGGGILVALLG